MVELFLLVIFLFPAAWALPEKDLAAELDRTIFPFYQGLVSGTIRNTQGVKLRYSHSTPGAYQKFLVILPGRTEPAKKYAETIFDLHLRGIGVFILDHQGQGASGRLLEDLDKGHVVDFRDFVADLRQWMNEVVLPASKGKELYLLGHSMGALIGTHYLSGHPDVFAKAVLCAPLFQLTTGLYGETIAKAILRIMRALGKENDYILGKGPYLAQEDTFLGNRVTHSLARFETSKVIYARWKENVMGGPTNSWGYQIIDKSQEVPSLAPKITIPILLMQAGQDHYVEPGRQEEFCRKAPDCRVSIYPQAYHEIFNETDGMRDRALRELMEFIGR
ncbi:MAG TPA: alpha/beta fold hydrolase [Bacteriovoracaceae bacterium]|nr:alpha/beta fold hydrolase [Bacteriovoracaceae bacterium]